MQDSVLVTLPVILAEAFSGLFGSALSEGGKRAVSYHKFLSG